MATARERVFSGVQPTGAAHLGNLLGAFRHWVADQDTHECMYCVVDLHSITVPYEPEELRRATPRMGTLLMAVGVDPERSILFVQSHVREHTELAWFLNCVATFGEVRRMTQFKEKSGGQESVSVGLFDYPVLQAADVLLYNAHRVPVGDDQRQHLELMRDVAIRFNGRFGETFVVPEASIPRVGRAHHGPPGAHEEDVEDGRDGARHDLAGRPAVAHQEEDHGRGHRLRLGGARGRRQARRDGAAGDHGRGHRHLDRRPRSPQYAGSQYGPFKRDVLDAVVAYLEPIQDRHAELAADPGEVERALGRSADRAREIAEPTMSRVRAALGLLGTR